jgi:hypothetical protein
MGELWLIQIHPNPLVQPPMVLIENVFWPIAVKQVGRPLPELHEPVVTDQKILETNLLKEYLQKLALRIQESVNLSGMDCFFCSACGVVGFWDKTRSMEMIKLEGYSTYKYEVQVDLRAKAQCETCFRSLDRMYDLTDRLVCTRTLHCGTGLKPALQV